MPASSLVLAYHGCDQTVAEALICRGEDFRESKNDYDWLGHGVYFWEDSPNRALEWAIESPKIQSPAVVGAAIDLGHCLNLIDSQYIELVQDTYASLKESFEAGGLKLPQNKGRDLRSRKLDCLVFETLFNIYSSDPAKAPFDTARAFFIEGKAIYPSAGIRSHDHIQICVRNPASIRGCFYPPELKNND